MLANVVPDSVMSHDVSLGRDALELFPVREFRDVTPDDTMLKLETTNSSEPAANCLASEINDPVGMIETATGVGEAAFLRATVARGRAAPNQVAWTVKSG